MQVNLFGQMTPTDRYGVSNGVSKRHFGWLSNVKFFCSKT